METEIELTSRTLSGSDSKMLTFLPKTFKTIVNITIKEFESDEESEVLHETVGLFKNDEDALEWIDAIQTAGFGKDRARVSFEITQVTLPFLFAEEKAS